MASSRGGSLAAFPSRRSRSSRSRGAFIALGIFLGGMGIHNFYAGYAGRGLGQIALTMSAGFFSALGGEVLSFILGLILMVWVILELIFVDEDAQGADM